MEDLFLGTVIGFKKKRGFGYIEPDDQSEFGEKVFCHWKTIQTSMKWPTLTDGMRVAFLAEEGESKECTWKTTEVYTEDGDEIGGDEQVVLLNKGKKYRGSCKSYNKSKGTGFIKTDGTGPWPKTGLKVLRSDISGDGTPIVRKGLRLQFQVAKEEAGYRAVNVTLPGGRNLPTEGGEKNQAKKAVVKKSQKKKGVAMKPQKKTSVVKKPQKKKSVVKKPQNKPKKKENRKRQLSQVSKAKSPQPKKKSNTGKKPAFKKSQISSGVYGGMEVDEEDVIEVGLILRSHWVGGLIGKKGATIREIRKLSEANMKFGDEDIELNEGLFKVFAISGTMNQVADACKVVVEKLSEASQTLEHKIVFLVPDSYCGMFIGKKGSTINEIRGDTDLRVRVALGQNPVRLPGSSQVTLCTVFGPRENMKDAIERTVAVLGGISSRMKKQMTEPMQQWGDRGRDGGYRGNTREVGGWSGAPRRGGRGGGRGGGGSRRGGRW